jgi:hypothetical protein
MLWPTNPDALRLSQTLVVYEFSTANNDCFTYRTTMKHSEQNSSFYTHVEVYEHAIRRQTGDGIAFYTPENPYVIIYDFFWDGTLKNASENFRRLVACTLGNQKLTHAREVASHIYLLEHLTSLLEGAYQLYKNEPPENILSLPEADIKTLYNHLYKKLAAHSRQPSYLSMSEWLQPRLVIQEFFTYNSLALWKLTLHRLLQSTLPSSSVADNLPWQKDIFSMCIQLHRLIEACWIIRITDVPAWAE